MKYNTNIDKLITLLKEKKLKVCIAESITGGMLAYKFIKKAGASKIFDFSIVSYSNESKNTFLNAEDKISKHGVVSKQVAKIMLEKIDKFTNSKKRLRLSCTGYASYNLSIKKKDVGTVFIGIGLGKKIKIIKKKFSNDGRNQIINHTVDFLILAALKFIDQ